MPDISTNCHVIVKDDWRCTAETDFLKFIARMSGQCALDICEDVRVCGFLMNEANNDP
jgi:hypothetical protein